MLAQETIFELFQKKLNSEYGISRHMLEVESNILQAS